MREKLKQIWSRAAPVALRIVRRVVGTIGLYLDDLLFLAAGVCFVRAAGQRWDETAALAVAGACCLAYAVVIARSRGGGGSR